MDKKIRNRILYITVASLWAIAIYRTYRNYQVKEENASTEIVSAPSISPIQFGKDTFDLELPDHDPFLKNSWTPIAQNEAPVQNDKPKNNIQKVVEKPAPKNWPQIEYFGFVKNRNQNSTLCLLKIDGRQVQLSKGEKYNSLIVQNVFKDSIQIIFEGDFKTIKK